ncbi:MAG: phosphoglycerate kinase [Desulfobacterales bacterium]|jgi:phosphoglycerate kinase
MAKMTVNDLNVKGKRVLMRVDFNVPLRDGKVTNDNRIRAALPTIRQIVRNGGRLVLMSHLGRPKGERNPAMSLAPCAPLLSQLLGRPVAFVDDCLGAAVESAVAALADGDILLLENLRYHEAETRNSLDFAAQLARLGDLYVNDAFGTAHRAHASTEGVTHYLAVCAAGLLMMKELDYLGRLLQNPEKPFVAVLGGAKISGKIDVIANLLPRVDRILIGGGMAFTFYKAKGFEIGASLLEEDRLALARELLEKAGDKLVLPPDCVVAQTVDIAARTVGDLRTVDADAIPAGWRGLDIGPKSLAAFGAILAPARTVVWNGPMGVFELPQTAEGTYAVARMLADITAGGAVTVIGGGDSAAAVAKAGVEDKVSHVSTGGGASLEFLEGKVLPGVAALSEKP